MPAITTDYVLIAGIVRTLDNEFTNSQYSNALLQANIENILFSVARNKQYFDYKFKDKNSNGTDLYDVAYQEWHSYCAYIVASVLSASFAPSGLTTQTGNTGGATGSINETTIKDALGNQVSEKYSNNSNSGSSTSSITQGNRTIGQEYFKNLANEILKSYTTMILFG